jgi:L-fuconolactonase
MSTTISLGNKRRFVDSHVHLWDPLNKEWYRFPKPGDDSYGLGDVSRWPMTFRLQDYRRALSAVDVVKFVHVSATDTPEAAYKETLWLEAMAQEYGAPNAIISTIDTSKPLAELERIFDRHMETPHYRGIRLLHHIDYESDYGQGLLDILSDRRLVYDAVAHPGGGISAVARAAARHPQLTFVLEHTGWPLRIDDTHWKIWKSEISEFAAIPGTICKLSGLGMAHHQTNVVRFDRYWEHCLRVFHPQRCMFGSNFPVDGLYGSFDELLSAFEFTARGLSSKDQDALFGETAERVYRI